MINDQNTYCSKVNLENNISLIKEYLNQYDSIELKNPVKSYEIIQSAFKLALLIKKPHWIAQTEYRLGKNKWLLGEFDEAIKYLNEVIGIAKKENMFVILTRAYNSLGNVYIDLERYETSLKWYQKALKESKKHRLLEHEGKCLNNIGEIYRKLKAYDRALDFYEKSITIHEKTGNDLYKSTSMINIGDVYHKMGEYNKAEKYAVEGLKICTKYEDILGIGYGNHLLAEIYDEMGIYDRGIELYQKCFNIYDSLGDRAHIIIVWIDLGNLYLKLEDLKKAAKYFHKAHELSEEINVKSRIAESCSNLARIYEIEKNFEKALFYYKRYHDLEKEDHKEKNQIKLNAISNQFEIEKSIVKNEIYKLKNIELKETTAEIQRAYDKIRLISEIGKDVTSSLELESVLSSIYTHVNQLMDAYVFGIGLYDQKSGEIDYKMFMAAGKKIEISSVKVDNENSLAAYCIRKKQDVVINEVSLELDLYVKDSIKVNEEIGVIESIIYTPLYVENEIIGVLTVQSPFKNVYTESKKELLKTSASYLSIALNNSKKSQELKLEIKRREEIELELILANKQLSQLSTLDGLTGVANRRKFDESMDLKWTYACDNVKPISLIIIDIDYFKEYNDYYGHLKGDECIKCVANILKKNLRRKGDLLARYGGDEFVIILPETDEKSAYIVSEKLRLNVEISKIAHEKSEISNWVTISMGLCTFRPSCDKDGLEKFINRADEALYEAKKRGKNRICVFDKIVNGS